MTNILQLVISPPKNFDGNSITGPERRAARLSEKWRNRGFNLIVCYPKRGRRNKDFEKAGVKVIDFEIKNKFNMISVVRLIKIILQNNIKIVHSQGPASLDLIMSISALFTKTKSIITRPVMLSDQNHINILKRKIYEFIDKNLTLKIVDKIICVSNDGLARMSSEYAVPFSKLKLIYNGVDSEKIKPQLNQGNIFNIAMIGQLFKPKGWYDFIDSIHILSKITDKKFKAFIIGDGEMKQELIEYVSDKGLSDIISFEGYVDDINNLLKKIDLILFTTHREGFSVAILEAMSAGIPQIVTNVGGSKEQIIHGLNGYIVEVGQIKLMAELCKKLMNSPDLLKKFGSESRKMVISKFSEKKMFDDHILIYSSLKF